jgi:large subunit ribosomal protein L28
MVSEKNEIKTRRYWRPNVHQKRLWSESLGTFVKIRITTRVLRTLDKVGGLDEYLLGEKTARIKELGMAGWKLRWRIMQTDRVKERFRVERVKFGLPPKEEVSIGANGQLMTKEQIADEVRLLDADLERGVEFDIGEDVQENPELMLEQPAQNRHHLLTL